MARDDKPIEVEHVACKVCMKEVPRSEATVPEAADYVAYFCGLGCYEKWKGQRTMPDGAAKKPTS